jgi:hypothetical protein
VTVQARAVRRRTSHILAQPVRWCEAGQLQKQPGGVSRREVCGASARRLAENITIPARKKNRARPQKIFTGSRTAQDANNSMKGMVEEAGKRSDRARVLKICYRGSGTRKRRQSEKEKEAFRIRTIPGVEFRIEWMSRREGVFGGVRWLLSGRNVES